MGISFLSVGGSTEDFTFYTSEGLLIKNKDGRKGAKLWAFEYASKIKVDQAYSTYGGGAANAAVNLSGLGFKTSIVTAVGDDGRGEGIRNNFLNKSVDVSNIQTIKGVSSSCSFIAVGKDREYVAFVSRGAANNLRVPKIKIGLDGGFDCIYLASLSGNWKENLKTVFSQSNNNFIFWNPGKIQIESGVVFLSDYLKKTDIVSLNFGEVVNLLKYSGSKKLKDLAVSGSKKMIMKFMKTLVKKVVILTNGKDGAYAFDGRNFYHQKALMVKNKVDTTGVGDAFASSFLAGFLVSENIEKSMSFAASNSKSVIGKMGAQNGLLTSRDFVKFFGKKYYG